MNPFASVGHDDVERDAKRQRSVTNVAILNHEYSMLELDHYTNLGAVQQSTIDDAENSICLADNNARHTPTRFRILELSVPESTKISLLKQLYETSRDAHRARYIDTFLRIPFNKFHHPFATGDPQDHIRTIQQHMDTAVEGHELAKRHIVRLVAQWLSGTSRNGLVIGLHGPMGVGKTSLVEKGISKALGLPYNHINLGGLSDASWLHGHHFSYENSTNGKIVSCLQASQCMNPLIFFDELDKISDCVKGAEIAQVLTFLTDPGQNKRFRDVYIGEHDIDLSKCVFVFSFNDISRIDPILLDRMTVVETKGYNAKQKTSILRKHSIPDVFLKFKLPHSVAQSLESNDFVDELVALCSGDDGMRNANRLLYDTVAEINVQLITNSTCQNPLAILHSLKPPSPVNPSLSMMYN